MEVTASVWPARRPTQVQCDRSHTRTAPSIEPDRIMLHGKMTFLPGGKFGRDKECGAGDMSGKGINSVFYGRPLATRAGDRIFCQKKKKNSHLPL